MSDMLLIGYGNPGRGDDGLGPALADRLEALGVEGLELISDYQLTVDMAHDIAGHQRVVFADAAMTGPEPFSYTSVEPGAPLSFTSHSQSPEGVLYLSRVLFGCGASAALLGIRGYQFDEFSETLSPRAMDNLEAALAFVVNRLLASPGVSG